MKRALIIANGTLPSAARVRKLITNVELVVCADGGANWARKAKIKPDIILGDLDSISRETLSHFKKTPVLFIDDQESTDLEKAIDYCLRSRMGAIDIVGATGSRPDHSAGGMWCFRKFGHRVELRLIDEHGELTLVQGEARLVMRKGDSISLIPLTRCTGIVTKNLKYPLTNEALELGVREGTSNEAAARDVRISVKRGSLLLYRYFEKA